MCIEFAFKRAGVPLIRNFLHQAEGVLTGLPKESQARFKIHFKLKTFKEGREVSRTYIETPTEGFPAKGDKK